MSSWRATGVAFAAMLAAAGCGGGEEKDDREPPRTPVVRCTPAPSDERSIDIQPRWTTGARRNGVVEKSREDTELDEPIRATSAAQIDVLRANAQGASIRWKSGDVLSFFAREQLPRAFIEDFEDRTEPLTIEYATDADGAFSGVLNLASLREQMRTGLNALEDLAGEDLPPRVLERIRQTAQSDAFLQTAVVEQPGLLHLVYGIEVTEGQTVQGEYELPNPFGGRPIPATAAYRLAERRDADGCVAIEVAIDPEAGAIANFIEDAIKRLAPGERPDRSEFEGMRLRQRLRFAYDHGSGWIARAEATKLVSLGARKRTERLVVTTGP